jgi:rubredoxin
MEHHRCQNCDLVFSDDMIIPLEEVKCLEQRVAPGEPTPSGECPECGALTHPEPSLRSQVDRACGIKP